MRASYFVDLVKIVVSRILKFVANDPINTLCCYRYCTWMNIYFVDQINKIHKNWCSPKIWWIKKQYQVCVHFVEYVNFSYACRKCCSDFITGVSIIANRIKSLVTLYIQLLCILLLNISKSKTKTHYVHVYLFASVMNR